MTDNIQPDNDSPVIVKLSKLNLAHAELPFFVDEMEGSIAFERLENGQFHLQLISVAAFSRNLGVLTLDLPPSHWIHSSDDHFWVDARKFDSELDRCFSDPFIGDTEKVRFEIGEPDVDGYSAIAYKGAILTRESLAG